MKTDFNKQGFRNYQQSTALLTNPQNLKQKQVSFSADEQPNLFKSFNIPTTPAPQEDTFQKADSAPIASAPVQYEAPVEYANPAPSSKGFGIKDGIMSVGVVAALAMGGYAIKNPKAAKGAAEDVAKKIEDAGTKFVDTVKQWATGEISAAKGELDGKINASGQSVLKKEYVNIWGTPIAHDGKPLTLEFTKFANSRVVPPQIIDSIKESLSPAGRKKALKALANGSIIVNPRIANISYEGLAGVAGGQASVAKELPASLKDAKADVFDICPLLEGKLLSQELKVVKHEAKPGEYKLQTATMKNPEKEAYDATKVFEKKISMVIDGNEVEKTMEVYHTRVNKRDVLFVGDKDHSFYIGNYQEGNPNIYSQGGEGCQMNEKPRMALFNKYTFELLDALKKGEVKLKGADGNDAPLKAADRLIAHETWQSGGIFAQMRINPVLDAHFNESLKPRADYFKELADSSLTLIHNAGTTYQGQVWHSNETDRKTMENIFGMWFGKDAKTVVDEALWVHFDNKDIKLPNKGSITQRAGFIAEKYNPATLSVACGGKVIPVSIGYKSDVVEKYLTGDLRPLLRAFDEAGAVTPIRNGIDRKLQAITSKQVDGINEYLEKPLYEGAKPIEGIPKVLPFHNADFSTVSDTDALKAKKAMKDAFMKYLVGVMPILKDEAKFKKLCAVDKNNWGHINRKAQLLKGTEALTDLTGVTENTPLFTATGRFGYQKGFDTTIDAVRKLFDKIEKDNVILKQEGKELLEHPVVVIAGNTENKEYQEKLVDLKKSLGEKGNRIVIFDGYMGAQTYPMLQSAGDYALMASNFEPCGIGDAEAMARFTPVIGSNVGGIAEKVTNGVNGIIMKGFFGSDEPTGEKAKDLINMEIFNHNSDQLANAMMEGLQVMRKPAIKVGEFTEHEAMMLEAGKADFSWYQKGADGKMQDDCPIANYLEAMHAKIDPELLKAT